MAEHVSWQVAFVNVKPPGRVPVLPSGLFTATSTDPEGWGGVLQVSEVGSDTTTEVAADAAKGDRRALLEEVPPEGDGGPAIGGPRGRARRSATEGGRPWQVPPFTAARTLSRPLPHVLFGPLT